MTAPPGHAHGQHRGRHGNPEDLAAYIAKMEDPSRQEWQRPDDVLRVLKLREGVALCDIGAGPGYFALRAARVVGAKGHVFAVDVEPRILEHLRERVAKAGVRNLTPVLALEDDPLLPPTSCDLILVVNTFHHFSDGTAYLKRLVQALRPGGHIVNVDFHKRDLPVGPPIEHKVARGEFLSVSGRAGLELVEELTFLPYQYFLILQPRR
jgi:ubiquinone/menaquinone biosynthesis C-methylase UbiE